MGVMRCDTAEDLRAALRKLGLRRRLNTAKASPKMQQVIGELAARHGVDLTHQGAYLRLEMPGFDRLSIEHIGGNRLSVAHYYEQMGDLIADPEIVFFTPELGWYPIEITQVFTGWRKVAIIDANGRITAVHVRGQHDVAQFTSLWRNIWAQGWIERGQLARVARPSARDAA